MSRGWRSGLAAAIWLSLVGLLALYFRSHSLSDLIVLLQSPAGPLVYFLICAIRPLAFFSALAVCLLAGSIWGPFLGTLYVVIGSNLSSLVAYAFARVLGAGVLSPKRRERWGGPLRRHPFRTILLMRLLFVPFDAVNYLAGAFRVPLASFVPAAGLGALPGTLSFALAGSAIPLPDVLAGRFSVSVLNPWALLASLLLLLISLVLSRRLDYLVRNSEGEPKLL